MAFVRGGSAEQVMVVPNFPVTTAYAERITCAATGAIQIVEASRFPEWAATLESQDVVCLIDPLRYPMKFLDLERSWQRQSFFCGATHFVSVGTSKDAVTEALERDETGRIRRIRRSYSQVAPPETANNATFASIVRASAIQHVTVESAAVLRAALSRKGVLSSDIPLIAEVANLSEEFGLLELNDWVISTGQSNGTPRRRNRSEINQRLSTSVSIHPSARLVGQVVLQAGSVVEKNVTIVGPSVIGNHARVGAGSTVVQSLVASMAQLPPSSNVLHRVVVSEWTEGQEASHMETLPLHSAARLQGQIQGQSFRIASGRSGLLGLREWAFVKRAIDVVLSLVGLVLLSPLLFIVSTLIKLDSSGRVFFSHRRECADGRDFPCVKFRTMVADAHLKQRELYADNEVDGPQFKLESDPRVTRLGNFLRRTNIDELPQLFNVLVGHMSLIGPRPSPFRENQLCVPWRRARLSVRPGLSGLWQICRDNREGGDFHQWIYFDLLYVRHRSAWLDTKILVATMLTLGGRWRVPVHWLIRRARLEATSRDYDRFDLQCSWRDSLSPSTTSAA
jgi:lipopolysaccharide/colanic/teichoic acid biosynthesis glycosyltransferase